MADPATGEIFYIRLFAVRAERSRGTLSKGLPPLQVDARYATANHLNTVYFPIGTNSSGATPSPSNHDGARRGSTLRWRRSRRVVRGRFAGFLAGGGNGGQIGAAHFKYMA